MFFYQTSSQIISKWQNGTLVQKRGSIPTHTNPWILNHYFVILGEALQFEAVVPQPRTFHMDLHPPTHVELKIPTRNNLDMMCLSAKWIF